MKILLLNPPNIEETKVESESVPLGLLSIKEFLLENSYQVELINLGFLRSWVDVRAILNDRSYDIVGITCYTPQRLSIYKLVDLCKELNRRCLIVLGGPHATFLDKEILLRFKSIDFIIRNEGEYTFLELLKVLNGNDETLLHQVKGLTFRNGETVVRNEPRGCITDLSLLPPPKFCRDDFRNNRQSKGLTFSFERYDHDLNVACILTSRGCNNFCQFCCNGAFWEKQNYFSPSYTFNQMTNLVNEHGVRFFDISDDDFLFSSDYVHELCDLIIANKLEVKWWCAGRVNNVDKDTLRKMRQAGCFMVSYGFETGSEKILKTINKNRTVAHAIESARLTKEAGLMVRCTLTIGHPGENEQSTADTIAFLSASKPDQIGLYLLKLYPGTPIYNKFREEGGISDDYWFREDNRDLPFYTAESSVEQQLRYRDMIEESLSGVIISRHGDNVLHNIHMRLNWV